MNQVTRKQVEILAEDLAPMAPKRVAVVIGRFNPPTAGHYSVIGAAKKFIRSHRELDLQASPVVIVIGGGKSDSDKKRNPLSPEERIKFMEGSGLANGSKFITAKNAFEAFASLRDEGLEPIAIAAGSDRASDYLRMLDNYFLTPAEEKIQHFKIELPRTAGSTDAGTETKRKSMDEILDRLQRGGHLDVDEISGSLARRAVERQLPNEFSKIVGLEAKPALSKKMFERIAASLQGMEEK